MQNKTYLKIIPVLGLILVLSGYYYVAVQIMDSKKELADLEVKKALVKQEMLQYQSKTIYLRNIINQTKDSLAIKKAASIQNNKVPIVQTETVGYEITSKNNLELALRWESKGFEMLFAKNVAEAIIAFKKSENAYNGFHMVYEISRYLSSNKEQLRDPDAHYWKNAYSKIKSDYSWKMSESVKQQLEELSKT